MPTVAATTTKTILLIDDDPQVRQVLARKLAQRGIEVEQCSDGREGLIQLRSRRFDGVLLDLQMPHVDGYAVLTGRSTTPNAETPLWVLTSLPNDVAAERVSELGATRLLNKHDSSPVQVVDEVTKLLL